jgi:formylglycine-generating enzyme required for sulfatase activity
MGTNPSSFKGAQNPVETVSWEDAVTFCKKLSQKSEKAVSLPTEAQWEYACRAGSTTRFCYGDDNDYSKLGDYAWFKSNSGDQTHPVGQKKPNGWGLYDMHGNIGQWCSDLFDNYADTKQTDPPGPAIANLHVLRGGCWYYAPRDCRSAGRNGFDGGVGGSGFGFRVVVELK